MSVYTYPAIFLEEPEGGYSIMFQSSLIGGGTQGDTIEEGMEMAMEVLALAIDIFKEDGKKLPKPEKLSVEETIKELDLENQGYKGFINYVSVDYESYAKEHFRKSIKKTVTIPKRLDTKAKKLGLNFSQILQEGLIKAIKKKEKAMKKVG